MTPGPAQRDAAWAELHDPNTSSARLAEIGAGHPEFAAAIVAHPNCYPELAEWARRSGLLGSATGTSAPTTIDTAAEVSPVTAALHQSTPDAAQPPVGSSTAGATLSAPAQPALLNRRDLKIILLFGLVGGIVFGVLINLWYWLLNNPLESLLPDYPDGIGMRALLSTGVLAVLMTTHGLFVGLLIRRTGAILATLALTLVTYFPTDRLLTSMLYPDYEPPDLLESLGTMLVYVGLGVILVGGIAELLRRFAAQLPDSLISRASIGLAVPLGWTLCFVTQLAIGQGGWPDSFEPIDWLVWLIGIAIAGLAFSGLIPAAVSGRWVPFVAAPSVAPTHAPPGAYAAAVPGAVSMARIGGPQQPIGAPGVDGLYEHPKATQVLTFALLGMFVFAPLAIAAWVTGAKAKAEVAQNPGRYRPSSSLQAGYVLGIIGTLVWAAGILALVVLLGWLATLR